MKSSLYNFLSNYEFSNTLDGATMDDFSNFHESHENVTEEIYDERFVF